MRLNKNTESLHTVSYSNNMTWFGVISEKKGKSYRNKVTCRYATAY